MLPQPNEPILSFAAHFSKTMKKLPLLFLLLCTAMGLSAQSRYTISGTIKDAANGEELIGATVLADGTTNGAASNEYGFYSLSLVKGKYKLIFSYTGYTTKTVEIDLDANKTINIELAENTVEVGEVVVTGEKADKNISENKMSAVTLDVKTAKKVPLLLGETDIIKVAQLLPGVQAAGDGSTLTIVRGGNIDHNLVQLDEAVVYNPSHVIGFFSVFNGDAIKDFEIYKGGTPAQYGGRLASVMDVRMKEGNSKTYSAYGGIGILSSRLTFEGPIKKDKHSFIVSARRSYFDLFFPLVEQTRNAKAYFGDLNAKMNFTLSKKDRLFLSFYTGKDVLGIGSIFGFGWGNSTGTVRWNRIINSKMFMNTSFIASRYNYNLQFNISPNLNLERNNYINDLGLKSDFTYYITPKNTLRFGLLNTFHEFRPGETEPITSSSIISAAALPRKRAFEQAYYISHKTDVNTRLNIEYGGRISIFSNVGQGREFTYSNGQPTYVDPANPGVRISSILFINDTTNYAAGEFYNTYVGFEPRLNAAYRLNASSSVKLSYNRMFQYLHLVQNTTASTGQEFWVPSNPYIKPQRADQVAVGYFRNFMDNKLEASAEVYYKDMRNTVEVIDNADLDFTEPIESQLVQGRGRAYGLELLVRKQQGRLNGWVSYTLSRSQRKAEGINNGDWYAFRFDRRHYATVVATYDLNDRLSFGANFVYASGEAATVPVGYYIVNGQEVEHYSDRNSFRLAPYHRLDLSVTLNRKKNPEKKYKNESNWVFSIYNVYNRKNWFSLSFKDDGNGQRGVYRTYLFGIIPSVTYNFKF